MSALLEITGLGARYGRITALADVSLSVAPAEVVAVVGPNGAGKSTLLNCITGVVRPATGEIRFDGQPITGRPLEETVRRGIAMVPEGRHVFAAMTVAENLTLGATIRRDRAAVRREIDAFMTLFPIIGARRNELAGRLSGGEQQMLVIARALLSQPRLLLLDEPSLGLAHKITNQVYQMIADLRGQGTAVLVVEQNADRALAAADRTLVMNRGQIRIAGPSAEVRADPGFEAAYFGITSGVTP